MSIAAAVMLLSPFLPWSHRGAQNYELSNGGVLSVHEMTSTPAKDNQGDAIVFWIAGGVCLITALLRTKWSAIPGFLTAGGFLLLWLDRHSVRTGQTDLVGVYVFAFGAIVFALLSIGFWKRPLPTEKVAPANAPPGRSTCDGCGKVYPSGFYLELSDNRYLCEQCRRPE